ncbi:magnesium transporter [Flectobacillus roseus]|uniref:Magnesium transporter MgtE n=1 Tax=Flectobacillus roseus TaxID=502259 RepID=A0ABT6YGC2_9BACT|nr:magnesium transporter [Flectobacillus roseus]MDI9862570.1 magnesium transporter [Flectobacillus roseus]MDI9871355.1 magnesium transporter [Flectobacillus roseus]
MTFREKILKNDFSDLLFKRGHKNYVHPSKVAQLFETLPFENALKAYLAFDEESQVNVFAYLDTVLQQDLLENFSSNKASHLLSKLNSDDRMMFLSSLKDWEQTRYINLLNQSQKELTHNLLGYPKDSVARIMNTNAVTIQQNKSVSEAIDYIRQNYTDNETADVIFVVDEKNKLIDDVPIRRLVFNEPDQRIGELLDHFCPSLTIHENQESAVSMFKEYDRVTLPVVNEQNVLMGVVTIDDILDVAERENTKDIQKIGGLEELDYPYVRTPFWDLIKKRAGWLIVLFLGEMLTASAMGHFETEIAKAVVLALFVPLIISSGGNSGSQAATLIIRAMALKEISLKDWWYVARRELLSGLTLGLVLGTIGFIRIALWQNMGIFDYGQHWILVGWTIFFSLIGIVLWGTLTGSLIPMFLKKLKLDPATSSAPFVATLVDVTGLVIYFSIASIILKGAIL